MTQTKKQLFIEFNELINNQHRFDLIHNYLSEKCLFHGPPYPGLGIRRDDTSGDKILITQVLPGGPAFGILQEGDEVVRFADEHRNIEGYEQLKDAMWGQGKPGTEVELTIRRGSELIDVKLQRALVRDFDATLDNNLESWIYHANHEWPDEAITINMLIEEGDLLAFFFTISGTNTVYNQSATWCESGMVRFEQGKIVEWWSVADETSLCRQLGYQITEPVKQPA